jgi:CO dehydrogenase maturation factor
VRGLIGGSEPGEREAVVLDMEASLEHMRRGTVRHVDTMLVVTEPYFRSLETSGRLAALGRELGLRRIVAIANKVRSSEEATAIREYCARHDLELGALIPFDPQVTRADNAGLALLDVAPQSEAVQRIQAVARSLNGSMEVA